MREDIDADIEETQQRRDQIMRSSLHEDTVQQGEVSDLSEELPEAASPTEETKVS